MDVYCTRPGCSRPQNHFSDLDDPATLRTVQQKFCTTCGMPQLLAGRYLPVRLLGQGGFGAAFLARDRYTPAMRQCVVKQFQPSGDLNAAQLQVAQNLFEREAQVLESLGNRHRQIPDLLAFFEIDAPSRSPGKADTYFYLVQEFIDGETLEEELARQGTFSEDAVREVLREILQVLHFVHENGSIHRDIKPSNIMRHKDGRLFLLDFGAVKQVTAAAGSPGGKASTGIYSMGFAPPEQMRGDMVYPATDLYALAVTCITLLTGEQPSQLYDAYSNTWKWRDRTSVSDDLATLLDQMLEATPSQRPQSAEAARASLNPVPAVGVPPVVASPTGTAAAAAPTTSLQRAAAAPAASASATPAPQSMASRPVSVSSPPSLLEYLAGAAFTGFEGGLLAIGVASLIGTLITPLFWVIWLVGVLGLVYAQSRRWIERMDLAIISVGTLIVVVMFPFLNRVLPGVDDNLFSLLRVVLILGILTGLAAVVIAIIFRLVYLLLSRVL